MQKADIVSFGVGLMRDFMRSAGIQWEPEQIQVPLLQLISPETNLLKRESGNLLLAMKKVARNDVHVYHRDFPRVSAAIKDKSKDEFLAYILGAIYSRYLVPFSCMNFIRYIAFIYNFAAYCMINRYTSSAPDYVILALVRTVRERYAFLGNPICWLYIFRQAAIINGERYRNVNGVRLS